MSPGLVGKPLQAIGPVIHAPNGGKPAFLGTGFFVDDKQTVMTAAHVIGDLREGIRIGVSTGPVWIEADATYLWTSSTFDIAVLRLDSDLDEAMPLTIATQRSSANADVLCMEFSEARTMADFGGSIDAPPSFHKGHVVTWYTSSDPELVRTEVLDVSFPAMKGASGAPIVDEHTGFVIGMLVANHERHLLPAHILRVDLGDGGSEEVRYFLPYGKAISWLHLRSVLSEARGSMPPNAPPA